MNQIVSLGLAALVLSYLAMDAVIFDQPREAMHRVTGRRFEILLSCPWCSSAYTAGAVVAVADRYGSVPLPALTWLAVWAVAAIAYIAAWRLAGE